MLESKYKSQSRNTNEDLSLGIVQRIESVER